MPQHSCKQFPSKAHTCQTMKKCAGRLFANRVPSTMPSERVSNQPHHGSEVKHTIIIRDNTVKQAMYIPIIRALKLLFAPALAVKKRKLVVWAQVLEEVINQIEVQYTRTELKNTNLIPEANYEVDDDGPMARNGKVHSRATLFFANLGEHRVAVWALRLNIKD